jgi:hypothetical protein
VEVLGMGRRKFVTVEEAAVILDIGRTTAYAATKTWRKTDGAEGIKVISVAGCLRVPLAWLEELAGGPIDVDEVLAPAPVAADPPVEDVEPIASLDAKRAEPRPEPKARPKRHRTAPTSSATTANGDQAALPFTG